MCQSLLYKYRHLKQHAVYQTTAHLFTTIIISFWYATWVFRATTNFSIFWQPRSTKCSGLLPQIEKDELNNKKVCSVKLQSCWDKQHLAPHVSHTAVSYFPRVWSVTYFPLVGFPKTAIWPQLLFTVTVGFFFMGGKIEKTLASCRSFSPCLQFLPL